MRFFVHHPLVRQLSLMPQLLPLSNLRFIGRLFLATTLLLWSLWLVDGLQQRDVLFLLTGGGRVLEKIQPQPTSSNARPSTPLSKPQLPSTSQANSGRVKDEDKDQVNLPSWLITVFRVPTLVVLGVITPLALYLWNWESQIYNQILTPYLMLLGAQAGSAIMGVLLLGEGIVPFIGLVYSILRVIQINDLLDLPFQVSRQMPKFLRFILRLALLLWALNAMALGYHILIVSWKLLFT
ncbi:MAG: hypothetical protein ACK587_11865 [Cyanobacteriota bacterium]